MLTFRLHMEFTQRARDEAVAVLRSLVGPVRSEPGCSATRLLTREEDGRKLTWVEEWRCVDDFERHLRGPAFRQILAIIEMAAVQPVVEIDDIASRRGFGLVEEMLGLTQAQQAESEELRTETGYDSEAQGG